MSSSAVPGWSGDGGIVDTMIGFSADSAQVYAGIRRSLRDRESLENLEMPAEYMFHDVPAPGGAGLEAARTARRSGHEAVATGCLLVGFPPAGSLFGVGD
jgi:hypothetical protein